MKTIFVTKESGDREVFSVAKLRASLKKSGARRGQIEEVLNQITSQIRPGMRTSEIYRLSFQLLKSLGKPYAARYSLKRSIMSLGPSGFSFEKYLAAILTENGYRTHTNQIFEGRCITHEVDVVAEIPDKNIHAVIEAKFHNRPGHKTGSKDAMYSHARFIDINESWVAKRKRGAKPAKGELQSWLMTNTKVTSQARQYAECVGMQIISWTYPHGNSLQDLIETKGLYPVTALTTLSKRQKDDLLRIGIVLCKDIVQDAKILNRLRLSTINRKRLIDEIQTLCGVAS